MFLWDPSMEADRVYSDARSKPWTVATPGQVMPSVPKSNPTIYPDLFWDSWKPLMMIRHPALTFPSLVRATKAALGIDADHKWVSQGNSYRCDRLMYDWYVNRLKGHSKDTDSSAGDVAWPLVVDSQDLLNKKSTIAKLCIALDLEPEQVRYNWDSMPEGQIEKQNIITKVFRSSIQGSTRVLADKTPQKVDVAAEYAKWVTEFGPEPANLLKKQVDSAMDDYEYLRSKRMV
jgi:hypothetical protein